MKTPPHVLNAIRSAFGYPPAERNGVTGANPLKLIAPKDCIAPDEIWTAIAQAVTKPQPLKAGDYVIREHDKDFGRVREVIDNGASVIVDLAKGDQTYGAMSAFTKAPPANVVKMKDGTFKLLIYGLPVVMVTYAIEAAELQLLAAKINANANTYY